jgi:hypothetical protein
MPRFTPQLEEMPRIISLSTVIPPVPHAGTDMPQTGKSSPLIIQPVIVPPLINPNLVLIS